MFRIPAFLEQSRTENALVFGTLVLTDGQRCDALFDTENDALHQAELDQLFARAESFIAHFQSGVRASLAAQIAREVSEAAYGTGEVADHAIQVQQLQDDLQLHEARFFPDAIVLLYRSPTIFEANDIVVQLQDDFSVDDIYADI